MKLGGQARDKAGELAEQAQPYVEQAKETAGTMVQNARPHAEKAIDWATGALNKVFDFIEEKTKTDLDRDGVIGAAVEEALEIEVTETAIVEIEDQTEDAVEPEVE